MAPDADLPNGGDNVSRARCRYHHDRCCDNDFDHHWDQYIKLRAFDILLGRI